MLIVSVRIVVIAIRLMIHVDIQYIQSRNVYELM